MLERLIGQVLHRPKFVLAIVGAITLFFAFQARALSVDFSLEQLFPRQDAEKDAYLQFKSDFVTDDNLILLVYESGDPLSGENLDILRQFTQGLQELPSIKSVFSLSNIERITSTDGLLLIEDYFPPGLDPQERSARKLEVQNHPLYRRTLLSDDGRLGGVAINMDEEYGSHADRVQLLSSIDSLRASSAWTWHDAGLPVIRTRYVETMKRERNTFLPIAMGLSLIVLYAMFRQPRALIYPLVAISATLIWVAGLMGLAGMTINIVSYLTFNLLLIVGISDSIHILSQYYELLGQGLPLKQALSSVFRRIGAALFLTSFTTATGFATLAFTNVRIVQEFGVSLAVGVILMFMVTLLVIPALLALTPLPSRETLDRHAQGVRLLAARRMSEWVEHHPRGILGVTVIMVVVSLFGVARIRTDAGVLDDLRSGNKVHLDYTFVEQNMIRILPLELLYRTPEIDGILLPENLSRMGTLQTFVDGLDDVTVTASLKDHIEMANAAVGDGTRSIPSSAQEVGELISLTDAGLVAAFTSPDFSAGRISARVSNIPSVRAEEIKSAVGAWARENLPPGHTVSLTGATLLALRTNDQLVRSMTYSFMLAFIVIFASMTALFKSLKLAALSVLPSVLPLVIVAGIMGLSGIKLRPTTAMIFAIAFGIAVDDTIHFIARFRQEIRRLNGNYRAAITETMLTTGKAIISTTVVLLLGFSVLLFSRFIPQFQFGLLAGLILLIALLASITLLPILIMLVRPPPN